MYRYRQNLMSSSAYTSSGYCYQASREESGRSMVEMLGVLAIIGVLSVGGIAGYVTAMNRYQANEILEGASLRIMMALTQLTQGADMTTVRMAPETMFGAEFSSSVVPVPSDINKFGVQVSKIEKGVCRALVAAGAGKSLTITKPDTPTVRMTPDECLDDKEQNTLAFIYDATNSGLIPPSGGGSTTPTDTSECTNGQTKCESGQTYGGGNLYLCENGQWTIRQCAGG